jgi:hypothetical protein
VSQQQLLSLVAGRLKALGIPCMLTGSLASSLQGEPRSTHDVDLVVDLNLAQVDSLASLFPAPDFYLSRSAMREAVQQRRMFNLLDLTSGDKVDFWLVTNDPFDQSRYRRRRPTLIAGSEIDVSTPEDTILMKLKWANASGGSEKQFHDALRVYEIQCAKLDRNYMETWLEPLHITELWHRLLAEAEPIE